MAALSDSSGGGAGKKRPGGAAAAGGIFTTVVLLLLAVVVLGGSRAVAEEELPHGERQLRLLYDAYAEEHGKVQGNEGMREARLNEFRRAEAYIQDHNNKRRLSFSLRHSRFSDMSDNERAAFFWRPHADAAHFLLNESLRMTEDEAVLLLGGSLALGGKEELPKSVNWATAENPLGRSVVTPPINQGHCGGCWSIVAASVVESAVALRHGPLTPLSAQELLDCDTAWNAGCMGGNPIQSFDYIIHQGLATARAYPYMGQQLPCRKEEVAPVSSIESYRILRSYDEGLLQRAVARQPVAVGVAGQYPTFLFYGGGIYDDEACGTELNHALVLVGYGTDAETGRDYWIAKNSWGSAWGEGGYIRLLRNRNLCGLATAPSIPLGAYGGSATALLEARKPSLPGNKDDNGQSLPPAPTNRPFDLPSWLERSMPGLLVIVVLLAAGTYLFGRPPSTATVARSAAAAGAPAVSAVSYQQQQHVGGGPNYQPIGPAAPGGFPAAVEGDRASRYGAV